MIKKLITGLLILFAVLISSNLIFGQKVDTIILQNGNILTGEVKKYEFGIIHYKMDGFGTVKIENDWLHTIKSNKYFEIIFDDGRAVYGSLDTSNINRHLYIRFTNSEELAEFNHIASIIPIKRNFWTRLDGRVDLGFSYTKGSEVGQLTFSGNIDYHARKNNVVLDWSSINTIQPGKDRTKKNEINISYQYYIGKKWYADAVVGTEQNSELGIDLRILGGLGASRDVVNSRRQRLFFTAGILSNREWAKDVEEATNNIEGLMAVGYKVFRYVLPEVDVTTTFAAMPSFTVKHRWRLNFDTKIALELFSDFYISISFYTSYDSKPASEDASTNDWGTVLSFGYSF